MPNPDDLSVYIRWSTGGQEKEHQRQSIVNWLEKHGMAIGEVNVYAEQASGASAERDEFQRIISAIEDGQYSDVVVWEISRIARKGNLAQRFFDTCEKAETTIHITNGAVRKIEPDGHGRMVADVIAAAAAEERRSLIRRTEAGLRRARNEGKWIGQVPAGFVRVDGYLRPNLAPDYDADETGYHDIADALEELDAGESYRSVAKETPNVSRPTLMNIHKDDERRAWYLDGEVEDERIAEAVGDMQE